MADVGQHRRLAREPGHYPHQVHLRGQSWRTGSEYLQSTAAGPSHLGENTNKLLACANVAWHISCQTAANPLLGEEGRRRCTGVVGGATGSYMVRRGGVLDSRNSEGRESKREGERFCQGGCNAVTFFRAREMIPNCFDLPVYRARLRTGSCGDCGLRRMFLLSRQHTSDQAPLASNNTPN